MTPVFLSVGSSGFHTFFLLGNISRGSSSLQYLVLWQWMMSFDLNVISSIP